MHSKVSGAYNAQETRALQSGHSVWSLNSELSKFGIFLSCKRGGHCKPHPFAHTIVRSFARSFVRTFVRSFVRRLALTLQLTLHIRSLYAHLLAHTIVHSFVRSIIRWLVLRTLRTHSCSFVALRTHTTTHAVLAAVLAVLSD